METVGSPKRTQRWPFGPSRDGSAWATRLQHESEQLRADLRAALHDRQEDHDWRRIGAHLDKADDVLTEHFAQGRVRRLIGASDAYQVALASVFRAREDLFLVQSDAALAARLPGLRAAVRSYLSSEDPRREIYLLRIDAALGAADERSAVLRRRPRPHDVDG